MPCAVVVTPRRMIKVSELDLARFLGMDPGVVCAPAVVTGHEVERGSEAFVELPTCPLWLANLSATHTHEPPTRFNASGLLEPAFSPSARHPHPSPHTGRLALALGRDDADDEKRRMVWYDESGEEDGLVEDERERLCGRLERMWWGCE